MTPKLCGMATGAPTYFALAAKIVVGGKKFQPLDLGEVWAANANQEGEVWKAFRQSSPNSRSRFFLWHFQKYHNYQKFVCILEGLISGASLRLWPPKARHRGGLCLAWLGFVYGLHPTKCRSRDRGIVTSIFIRNKRFFKKEFWMKKFKKQWEGRVFSLWKRRREMVQSTVSETDKAGSAYHVTFGGWSWKVTLRNWTLLNFALNQHSWVPGEILNDKLGEETGLSVLHGTCFQLHRLVFHCWFTGMKLFHL